MSAQRRRLLVVTAILVVAATTAVGASAARHGQRVANAGTTLVVAAANTPTTMDPEFIAGGPQGWEMDNVIYDEKIYYKTNRATGTRNFTQFEPRLFASWQKSADGKTWTFHLRKGAKSNLGNEFTSADIVWSFQRAFALKGLGYFLAIQANLTKPENVVAVDKYTVQFKLDAPILLFLHQMTLVYHAPFDTTEVKKHTSKDDPWATKWLGTHAAGYGSYYIDSFVSGQQVVLKRNPNFYGPKPYFDTVIYKAVPDPSSRAALLKSGDVDIAEGLSPEQLNSVKSDPKIAITATQGNTLMAVIPNEKKAPLDNVLVRKALNFATPYEQILNDIYKGYADATQTTLPPIYPGYLGKVLPYKMDIAKAKALMKQSGVKTPLNLSITFAPFDPTFEQVSIALRTAWQQIGVNLTLNQVTPARFQQLTASRGYDMLLPVSLSSHNADPLYTMEIFSGGPPRSCCNWGNWVDKAIFAIFDKAHVEQNPATYLKLVKQIQRMQQANPPWVIMGARKWTVAHAKDVKGFIWSPQESIWFNELTRG